MIVGDGECFDSGLKELARCINRHEKSIGEAVKSLETKKMIQKEKSENKIHIKLTLSYDELYTRMTFIDPMFCNSQSIYELQEDLFREIKRIKKEILHTKEVNVTNYTKDSMIDSIIEQVNDADFNELITNMRSRTYANSNKSFDEIVIDALKTFRVEVFEKYGDLNEDSDTQARMEDTYENFWSINKR